MRAVKARNIAILIVITLVTSLLSGCSAAQKTEGLGNGWEPVRSMEPMFADQFTLDYYEGGYKLLCVADGSRFLIIPEGEDAPEGISSDIVLLYQPLENIYLAATAAMCLFDALDSISSIKFSGTKAENWYVDSAREAMERGDILFAGKYSEPDYEMLLGYGASLAIESTMIGHASEVKDKLEELGIPVLVDHSGMETHPLGRTEWIKVYGALLDKEEEAEALFAEQVGYLQEAANTEDTGKTAAFFYISSSGRVVARRTGDYVTQIIELAGGHYVFDSLGDPESNTSTVTIEMEAFFAAAKDADYIIYNSTIGGEVSSLEELLEKNVLLAEFKAVQSGNVWCTEQNMYQETTQLGKMIRSFNLIFSGEADDMDRLPFLYRLK